MVVATTTSSQTSDLQHHNSIQSLSSIHKNSLTSTSSPPLSVDREIGGAIPQSDAVNPEAKSQALVGKSLAHFIAGGYTLHLYTTNSVVVDKGSHIANAIRVVSAGGMTAAVLTSPLDVIKTRLQSDFYQSQIAARRAASNIDFNSQGPIRSGLRHFQETFELLFGISRQEGWRALFKGLGPNLAGVVPARAINFYTYGNGKRIIADKFNNGQEASWVHLCAAAVAGVVTGTATNPIWLVKTRLQLDKDIHKSGLGRQYKNSWDCIKQTVRNEGIRGMYRGLSASYLGVTESTLQWVLYERMKMALARRQEVRMQTGRPMTGWDSTVEWSGKLGAAGAAKLIATGITYPHEVVRTRLRQAPMADGRPKYTGLVQCFRLVLKEEGLASMYGGMTSHMLKVVPSSAIMFGMYEIILRAFGTDASLSKA